MIPVNRLTSRAVRLLGLQSHPSYDDSDALSALAELLIEDGLMTTDIVNSVTVTTVDGQSEYSLGEGVARIQEISWPTDWPNQLMYVTIGALQTIRQVIADGTFEYSDSQPMYYSYYQNQNGSHVFALEPADAVAAGLSIVIHYDSIDGAEITKGSNLNLPVTMFPFLRAGLCMHLARQYEPKKSAEFAAEHQRLREEWNRRNTYLTNEAVFRPNQPF